MSEEKETKTATKGGFFGRPLNSIWHMVVTHTLRGSELPLEVEEIQTYICLCRGVGRFASSGWTEHAIATYCAITQGRAATACTYLVDNGLLTRNEDYQAVKSDPPVAASDSIENEHGVSDIQPKNRRHRYFLNRRNEGPIVYLPNCIVDGLIPGESAYPLSTLSKGSFFSQHKGVSSKEARLDAIILLLVLYKHHDLQIYGGVNRHLWSVEFPYVDHGDGLAASPPISELGDTGYSIHEVARGEEYFQVTEISTCFSYISGEEIRYRRINAALKSLLKLRFVYEVLQVWSGSPHSEDNELEIEYPLYVCDSSQRANGEPSLGRKINSISFLVYDPATVFPRDEAFDIGRGMQFRFVCDGEKRGQLISSLRMKYRPHDHDCGIGMNEQSAMVSIGLNSSLT